MSEYIIPMRAPSAPRKVGTGKATFMPGEYRQAQYELRKYLVDTYGRFETVEPAKRIPAAPSKGRQAQEPFRNVRIDYIIRLAGNSPNDCDNCEKWLLDSLGPITARTPLKRDLELNWQPLYRNDRQVLGGLHIVVDHQEYSEIWFRVTVLAAPLDIETAYNNMPQGNNEVSND